MADCGITVEYFDLRTTKEWFYLTADGVPEDVAEERLEVEATRPGSPESYKRTFYYAKGKPYLTGESAEGLSVAEQMAIRMYTTEAQQFYWKFNEDCRIRQWQPYLVYAYLMHSVCVKLRNKPVDRHNRGLLYRGINGITNAHGGGEFCWPGFTSTSPSRMIAEQFGTTILTLECDKGAPVKEFSELFEYELLFSPFHVFSSDTGKRLHYTGLSQQTDFFLSFSHFRGALLGVAVGNCLGAPFEFNYEATLATVLDVFKRLDEKLEAKGSYRYASDVSMTFALAKSLVEKNGLDYRHLSNSFANEFSDNPYRNYGNSVAVVLRKFTVQEPNDDPFAPAKELFNGVGSHGNGAAMRIAPAALFFFKMADNIFSENVRRISSLTHSNVIGVNGAILLSVAIQLVVRVGMERPWKTDIRRKFLDDLLTRMRLIEFLSHSGIFQFCAKLQKMKEYLTNPPSMETVRNDLGNDMSALESVPTAIYCFLRAMEPIQDIPTKYSPFERTIIYAILVGLKGDTDTIASMAGAVAGAYYGQDAIPQKWRDACEAKAIDDAKRYAKEIHGKIWQ